MPASGFFVGLDPRFEVFDIPGVFDDIGHAARTLSDPAVREHFATLGNEQGMEPLDIYPHWPMMLLSDKAVRTPADFYTVRALVDAQELDSRASTGAIYWEGLS